MHRPRVVAPPLPCCGNLAVVATMQGMARVRKTSGVESAEDVHDVLASLGWEIKPGTRIGRVNSEVGAVARLRSRLRSALPNWGRWSREMRAVFSCLDVEGDLKSCCAALGVDMGKASEHPMWPELEGVTKKWYGDGELPKYVAQRGNVKEITFEEVHTVLCHETALRANATMFLATDLSSVPKAVRDMALMGGYDATLRRDASGRRSGKGRSPSDADASHATNDEQGVPEAEEIAKAALGVRSDLRGGDA